MDKMFSLSESDSDLSDDDGVVDQSQHASGAGGEEGADGKRRTKSLTAPRPGIQESEERRHSKANENLQQLVDVSVEQKTGS
ncbi:UNVERIFIED_CONTAM: hypothetical protein FKN15_024549 [Acipenser sinensis]